MNGRVYDYNAGRFLSVDPIIQAPSNSQSLNPYSYVMNNPLWGTDPSGYCSSGRIGAAKGSVCGGGAGSAAASLSKVKTTDKLERVEINQSTGTVTATTQNGGTLSVSNLSTKQTSALMDIGGQADVASANDASSTNENQHVPLTGDERQFAKDGMLKEYWNSRHDRGDPWAAAGLALWDPEHKAVTDAHRDMAKVLQGRLIYEGVASDNLSSSATLGEMKTFMKDVGVAVMRGHAVAVQRDFSGKLGDRHGVLDKYQAAVFHHKVFSGQGLRPFVYGGTPIGVGNYVPFINIQAKVSNWVAGLNPSNKAYCGYMCFGQGYISNEDTHHDPAGR
ncbi:RHS repeat-associated core domain-containing protein [Glaciecola sp. KUL10]|uniref:RHS repeat-associated core domain-containing protein n=1 Tax=Glaciecola sp. (strain KUL10) TaxID=2161813 RepID=UPI000D783C68|nr:RHS repeat-associated core domain-containing protein [Glaciecola sp. KUL10]GBL06318.1 hypothetical protein KUL10_36580 [Glaciecola sp. KUL10]